MVRILIFFLFVLWFSNAYSQLDTSEFEMGWPFEESPVFDGDLREFIQKNICYPDSALKDSMEGIVYVQYLIDTSGLTKKHTIVKGVREDLEKEAIRVARLIKYNSPAKLHDKPVLFYFTIPIKFDLSQRDSSKAHTSPCWPEAINNN